jgi:putative ABC transport system permease protein
MRNVRLIRNVRLGIKSLLLHKLRSVLTMLGVVFGVGSVVAMLSVGEGASQETMAQIRKLGSTNIIINAEKPSQEEKERNRSSGRSRSLRYGLKYEDAERIRTSFPAVKRVVPAKIVREEARVGDNAKEVRVVGTTPEWFTLVEREVIAGDVLNDQHMRQNAGVCVLAEEAARELLAGKKVLGEVVRIGGEAYYVIGIVRSEGSTEGGSGVQTPDRPVDAYIPLTTARERVGDTNVQRSSGSFSREEVELHQIIAQVGVPEEETARRSRWASWNPMSWLGWIVGGWRSDRAPIDYVEPTANGIEAMLERFHDQRDYAMSVPLALLRQARQTQQIFNIVLGSIAGISLLVGGIGIMNIMLASVTERTREIGVRRAIGAKRRQIVGQFLIETIVLSMVGGLIGVAFGVAIPEIIERAAGMPTVITPWSIVLSLGISVLVGVVFGLYPAYRAAGLDPIIALRHE